MSNGRIRAVMDVGEDGEYYVEVLADKELGEDEQVELGEKIESVIRKYLKSKGVKIVSSSSGM